jgi:hypothetical protein
LGPLRRDGSLSKVGDRLVSFEERQRVVQKDIWDGHDAKYRSK